MIQHIHMQHLNMLGFALICVAILIFNMAKWDFIKACLSEGNNPSSTRLFAYMFTLTICLCELYTTLHTMKFDTTHLLYLLIAIGVLVGLIKSTEITGFLKGNNGQSNVSVTTKTEVKTDQNIQA